MDQTHKSGRRTAQKVGYSLAALLCFTACAGLRAQETAPSRPGQNLPADHLQKLVQALDQTQQQLERSQQELSALRLELEEVRRELAGTQTAHATDGSSSPTTLVASAQASGGSQGSVTEIQQMQATQIATLDQIKVESESKYPVRVTGTILLNGFINSGRVDEAAAPSAALGGPGSTGLSVSQTILGLDAQGPRLFGGHSFADLRADFFSSESGQTYAGPLGLLRLRTAHAALAWRSTQLFFAVDRPILNPNAPESLVALGQPEMAWSGNLWSWSPQVGVTHDVGTGTRLRLQAAAIDPVDPVPSTGISNLVSTTALPNTTLSEASRRLGWESRIAVLGRDDARSAQFGVGGYFAPHFVSTNAFGAGSGFNAWAVTADARLPLTRGLVLSADAYRGLALGGLGGGGYKDYVYRQNATGLAIRPLDAVGGWAQIHQGIGQRLSWNAGFGMDNAFAKELRAYPGAGAANLYGTIARNRTIFANVIYSPSAYLQVSMEYRNLYTAPAPGRLWVSNTVGAAAAYRF